MKPSGILLLLIVAAIGCGDKAAPPPPEQSGETLPPRTRPASGERGAGR